MTTSIPLQITGLGIIIYSPWAVAAIPPGMDYLSAHYWEPSDVAHQVNQAALTCVGTGSPGDYLLHFHFGRIDEVALAAAEFRLRLGLEVRDGTACVRDLYDLRSWEPFCPQGQRLALENGFYRVTAYTSPPQSGVLGDHQDIHLHLHSWAGRPDLVHHGVPQLC